MADCRDFITVIVIEGRELISADYNTRSDPYTKIYYGHNDKTTNKFTPGAMQQTACISFTLHPVWSTALFTFNRQAKLDQMLFEVWDEDAMRAHDFLGQTSIHIPPPPTKEELAKNKNAGIIDEWLDLKKNDKGDPTWLKEDAVLGKLHVRIYNGVPHPIPQPDPLGESIYLFDDAMPHMKTGDCILYSGSEVISDLIKKKFDSPYSHCGIVLKMPDPLKKGTPEENNEEVFIAEADWDDGDYLDKQHAVFGIVLNKFQDRMKAYAGNVIWHCPLVAPLTPANNKLVCEFVMEKKKAKSSYAVGKGFYMMVGLGGKMNAEADKDNTAVICSELVALALKHVQIIDKDFQSSNADPYTVASLAIYEGKFPKRILRYQTKVDPERVAAAGAGEIWDLIKRD